MYRLQGECTVIHAGTWEGKPRDDHANLLGENARLKQMLAAAAAPDSSSLRSETREMAAARAETAKLEAEIAKIREALETGARYCSLHVSAHGLVLHSSQMLLHIAIINIRPCRQSMYLLQGAI